MIKTLAHSIGIAMLVGTAAVGVGVVYGAIHNKQEQFTPIHHKDNLYIVDNKNTLMGSAGGNSVVTYSDCNTVSNAIIGIEVNNKPTMAVLLESTVTEDAGVITFETPKEPIKKLKALIPCLDGSINAIDLKLGEFPKPQDY